LKAASDASMPDSTFLDSTELVLNMGPQHPSTHGVLRVILKLDGEKILGTDCVIGYLHRGVEKIAENRTWAQFNPYVDRMDYVAAVSNGLGYCLAVEKLLNIEAPPRAQVVRVILTELCRIASHLVWLGTHALDIGAHYARVLLLPRARRERSRSSRSTAARGSPRTPSASAGRESLLRHVSGEGGRVRRTAHQQPHLVGGGSPTWVGI
jgi:NADH:ubiquinone oxidoreductase subunit D